MTIFKKFEDSYIYNKVSVQINQFKFLENLKYF